MQKHQPEKMLGKSIIVLYAFHFIIFRHIRRRILMFSSYKTLLIYVKDVVTQFI